MSNETPHDSEERHAGIPRDLPDQDARQDADPGVEDTDDGEALPDTDEAGSGPRRTGKEPQRGDREMPEPDEPTD